MSLINCCECGKEISDKSTNCIHCGCPIEKKIYCGECGQELLSSYKVCTNCGCPVGNNSNVENNSSNINYVSNDFQQVSNTTTKENTNNLCLAGMIVGIVSFFIDFYGLVSLTGLILSIVGYNQVKDSPGSNVNRARIGIVCSSIELVLKFIQLMILMSY